MKKYLPLFILPFVGTMALAQTQPSVVVSLGSGISNTSASVKKDTQIGNGYQIKGDVFVPFLRKGWDGSVKGSGKFALGIIAGGEYNWAKNIMPDAGPVQSAYKLYSGNLDIMSAQKGSLESTGFTGLAGLQAGFTLGKITLSPSVSGAYFSLTQGGFTQSSEVMVNGTTQTIVLSESPQTKRTGFITRPQLQVSYPLTGSLSFYAAGSINIGPNIKSSQSQLVPSGGFNAKNTYEATQLTSGTRVSQTVETKYQTIAINAGFSWSFGSGSANSKRHIKGKITRPGDGGMRYTDVVEEPLPTSQTTTDERRTYTAGHKVETSALAAGNPIGGIIVKGGKNPGGGMISVVTNNNGEIELKGLEAGNYKFTIIAPEQTAGKGISEKGVSSTKGRPKNMVFSPGNPIGGIIIKGGKNPGGSMMVITTNDNGEFEFNGLEAGDYKFTIITPEQPAEKGHSEKGMKRN